MKAAALLISLLFGMGVLAADDPQPAPRTAAGPDVGVATKTLRYAFLIAETTFDPAQVSDLYSRTVLAGIFDAPYEWEFLAQPTRMRPATAVALPEVSDDFKTFTIRIKPGIHFADDPVFQGRKRELVGAGLIYERRSARTESYVFKHALVRDSAYETLTRPDRQRLHLRVANTMCERFPHVTRAQPEFVAAHFEQPPCPPPEPPPATSLPRPARRCSRPRPSSSSSPTPRRPMRR